ncbi:MAG: hypothetical protein N3H30_02580 [Candidatus Micrarchaeota archaeon]|nr:hypothetical protein [Candidatus Micrarchaeota archaeon]
MPIPCLTEKQQLANNQIPIRILLRDRIGRSESHTVYARYGENLLDVLSRNFEVTLKSGELGTWVTSIRGKGIHISEDASGGLQGYVNGTLPYTIVNSSPFFLGFTNIAVTSQFELRMQYDPYLEDIRPPLSLLLRAKIYAVFDTFGKKKDNNALIECASCSVPLNESLRKSIGLVVASHEIMHYAVAPPAMEGGANTAIASVCCGSLPLPQACQEFGTSPAGRDAGQNAYFPPESIVTSPITAGGHLGVVQDGPPRQTAQESLCFSPGDAMLAAREQPTVAHSAVPASSASSSAECEVVGRDTAPTHKMLKPTLNGSGLVMQARNAWVQDTTATAGAGPMDLRQPAPKRRERRKLQTKTAERRLLLPGPQPVTRKAIRRIPPAQSARGNHVLRGAPALGASSGAKSAGKKPVPRGCDGRTAGTNACGRKNPVKMQCGAAKQAKCSIAGTMKHMGAKNHAHKQVSRTGNVARVMFIMDRAKEVRLKSVGAKRGLWNRIRALARRMLRLS